MKTLIAAKGMAICFGTLLWSQLSGGAPLSPAADHSIVRVVVRPTTYPNALKNPLKGFRAGYPHPFGTLKHTYIPWNILEDKEQDGVDKICRHCDHIWKDFPQSNVKAIPRVWLGYPGRPNGWPSDMQKDDYSSPQFRARVVNMVKKLGQCWDCDPRVAYVEMGIIGKWGEQHTPYVSAEMQKILGDVFSIAFTNKLVMVRHAEDFRDYHFGIYWDSWAHQDEMNWAKGGGIAIAGLGDRWKTAVMGGETAYNWGNHKIQPGDNPTDTLTDPGHLGFLLDTIRQLHCNHLGWISDYDRNNPGTKAGAENVQKALGYRFVIDEVSYPATLSVNKPFKVLFTVRNTGSSPFYYNWPVELSLLHPQTRKVVWRDTFKDLDIRQWLPGDKWNRERRSYDVEPQLFNVEGTFTLPESVSMDEYILSLAILDPAGMLPSARFAICNYFKGGRHPIGVIGIAKRPRHTTLDPASFDNPGDDTTLHYTAESRTPTKLALAAVPVPVPRGVPGACAFSLRQPAHQLDRH